ncbi:hypothetical protein U1Q18_005770 [Sarracenia purpurea var. burkii]
MNGGLSLIPTEQYTDFTYYSVLCGDRKGRRGFRRFQLSPAKKKLDPLSEIRRLQGRDLQTNLWQIPEDFVEEVGAKKKGRAIVPCGCVLEN